MKFLGNLVWLILGGLLTAILYWIAGLLMCLTIVGIPFGVQIMRLGMFALWPFGGDVKPQDNAGGCLSIVMNVLWIIFGGIEVALTHLALGIGFCITIIGIPFGMQHFKLMLYALLPFGHRVVRK